MGQGMLHPLRGRARFFTSFMLGAAAAWSAISLSPSLPPAPAATAPASTTSPDPTPPDLIQPADTLELTGLQSKFEQIARTVSPSVVSISAAAKNPAGGDAGVGSKLTADQLEIELEKTARTVGTGFAVDHGFIVTNEHVVAGCDQIWITTDDHKVMPAIVVGSDPRADLAVLKISSDSLPPVTFGDSTALCRGQWTIALGNPLGLATEGEECMSVGVIAATGRSLPRLSNEEDRYYSNLIQTTAQINPGSSGGPLFDISGKVIGINTAVILPQKETNGIGFAIPATPAIQTEIGQLERGEKVTYAYLGVRVSDLTADERALAGLARDAGVRVESVEPQSPAAEASLQPGDLILRLGQQSVYGADQFSRLAGAAAVDKPAQLQLSRDGKTATAMIIPRTRPGDDAGVWFETQHVDWRGMRIENIPPDWKINGEQPRTGVLVCDIDADSPMKPYGIASGTLIDSVGGRPVSSVCDLFDAVSSLPSDRCTVVFTPTVERK
jgi:serine protease Do